VAGTDEIRFWIMTWGSKAEALGPGSLREEIWDFDSESPPIKIIRGPLPVQLLEKPLTRPIFVGRK